MANKTEIAVFGGGCFWCTEAVFEELKGIVSVTPGYAGGTKENPTFEEVVVGKTGHAEVSKVEFDPSQISYDDLLTVFFASHDPTSLNRQQYDVGTEYRSIVLYTVEEQKTKVEKFIANLNADIQTGKIVTEVKPLDKFYPAEGYHQQYYRNNPEQPYCQIIINPKLEKLQEKFSQLLKEKGALILILATDTLSSSLIHIYV